MFFFYKILKSVKLKLLLPFLGWFLALLVRGEREQERKKRREMSHRRKFNKIKKIAFTLQGRARMQFKNFNGGK